MATLTSQKSKWTKDRVFFRRASLRVRVVLAILAVATAPQIILFAWSQIDRKASGLIWGAVRDAAAEAIARKVQPGEWPKQAEAIATKWHLRVRVFAAQGGGNAARLLAEAHELSPESAFDRLEAFFLGEPDRPNEWEVDEENGPPLRRSLVRNATDVPTVECEFHGGLLVCEAAVRTASSEIVITEATTRRAVQMVYALRHQLVRIALVTFPLAVILAFYMGRRVARPLAELRDEALAQSARATKNVALSYAHADEVGDLARALNELLGALATKSQENERFVTDLVHELKNPVAAIRASADSVTADLSTERAERIARVLRDSTGKMDKLVTQFLELARAEAGMPAETRAAFDVADLLRGMVASASDDERHRAIRFELSAPSEPVLVMGVDHRIEGALRELLENAASFSAGGRVRIDVAASAREVAISVSDDGPGIAPEQRGRVFERFFTTRAGANGTGLGLAMVRAVAEAHGGSVSVAAADEEGARGARFTLVLPGIAPRA